MKSKPVFVVLLVALLTLILPAAAQEKPARFAEVVTVHVKSEAVEQFEDVVKKYVEAWEKIGGAQYWGVANVMAGGAGYDYMFSFPFETWSAVDQWTEAEEGLVKAFGEAEAKKITRAWNTSVEGMESAVYVLLEDMITHADKYRNTPAKYYTVTRTEVKPGMQWTYELNIKKYREAEEKIPETKMATRHRTVFGPAGVYLTTRAWDKLGEADEMPSGIMQKAYGAEEARQISEAIASCIKERRTLILGFRPDLSRLPKAEPTTN